MYLWPSLMSVLDQWGVQWAGEKEKEFFKEVLSQLFRMRMGQLRLTGEHPDPLKSVARPVTVSVVLTGSHGCTS